MAEAVTVENINIAAIMESEAGKKAETKLTEIMESNPVVSKLVKVAETVEDVYQIAKEYFTMKFEDFKVLFERTVNYFKESKAELSDEVLDNVVGGWSFSGFWNKYKSVIIKAAIVVGATAVAAIAGAVTGGAAVAFVAGSFVGLVATGAVGTYSRITGD